MKIDGFTMLGFGKENDEDVRLIRFVFKGMNLLMNKMKESSDFKNIDWSDEIDSEKLQALVTAIAKATKSKEEFKEVFRRIPEIPEFMEITVGRNRAKRIIGEAVTHIGEGSDDEEMEDYDDEE